MSSNDKRMLDREALRSVIQQWNANRLDLFELSEPNENLEFHGVMRFYFQDTGQKVATKCIRVASDATVSDVIKTLIEKFRPDMRMLSVPNYAIYEVHSNGEERKLNPDEKPLLVQLNWHVDDREGRFLLRNLDAPMVEPAEAVQFKRKLSKREKKDAKKKEKMAKLSGGPDADNQVAEKLYTELPETSFTRSISNPEAVMRRRRQQKLEKKLQQFRSKDGGPDTGGTLKIYGESLCRDVPYKTLLLSIRDCAQAVVREMLAKYGMDKADPAQYCLVQVNSDGEETVLYDDECPLSILMNHPTMQGSIMFHVRRRPAEVQPRRRKKKSHGISNGSNLSGTDREGPTLVEVTYSGDGARRKLTSEPLEVGSANTNALQIFGPSIQARHCLISLHEGVCTVTPLHADAVTFVNGHRILQPTVLHNGSVVMFGRGASYRFLDAPADGRYNLALSQSQLDSAYLYESRSPTTPTAWHDDDSSHHLVSSSGIAGRSFLDTNGGNSGGAGGDGSHILDASSKSGTGGMDPLQHHHHHHSHLNNTSAHNHADSDSFVGGNDKSEMDGPHIETDAKSISSNKSAGSAQDRSVPNRIAQERMMQPQGQEQILPAVLEFPEIHQEAFLTHVITELDANQPNFKLAPVYTLYLCARYRASTHYRPELQPTERAQKLTEFLHHVANLIYDVVVEQRVDNRILSFWIANASEFLHFLKSDRHISAFSVQAQDVLQDSVVIAFKNLVQIYHNDLSGTLNQFLSENVNNLSAATFVQDVLSRAMSQLRHSRVNAALTIQLFSHLFHYISVVCFNRFVTTSHMCTAKWGRDLSERLAHIENWAETQGLELAAESHLSKINQCAQLLQAPKTNKQEVTDIALQCFRLNSPQVAALLQETCPPDLIPLAVSLAVTVADDLIKADNRAVELQEKLHLPLSLLIPEDGFSCEVVRGIPAELVEFIEPLERAGMCRLAPQPTSVGLWTVYMHQFNGRSPSVMSTKLPQPEIQTIKLHKNSNGMGLSIVAAKGAGQERLGIYIKSVVPGGAADVDGRLQAGDQLLRVDGQNLIGITQERAADHLVRTGPIVTLDVAKQGAIYHGLATLLQQPSPIIQRGGRKMISDFDLNRSGGGMGAGGGGPGDKPPLPNSKSVPSLHHGGGLHNNHHAAAAAAAAAKSRSINNLIGSSSSSSQHQHHAQPSSSSNFTSNAVAPPDQGFYQNLSVYRAQNQSQPNLGDRSNMPLHSPQGPPSAMNPAHRPPSTYYTQMSGPPGGPPNAGGSPYHPSHLQMTPTFSHPNLAQAVQQQQRAKNFMRESQGQQSLRGPGMVPSHLTAPSMPNIAHSSGYGANMQASQSMQNVNGGTYVTMQQHFPPGAQQNFAPRGSSMKGAEMINEMMSRRSHSSMEQIAYQQQSPQKQPPQGYPYTRTMSPLRQPQLPPTAPKPPRQVVQAQPEELSPPLPPTSTHPLYKQTNFGYVASSNEPPKVGMYPAQGPKETNKHVAAASANPWEREEREKEQEFRREQARMWRDQQIVELRKVPNRSPQQEDQLRTLLLEQNFERRALEEQVEEENEGGFSKTDAVEVVRLQNRLKEVVRTSLDGSPSQTQAPPQAPALTASQPKSILKNNASTSSPSSPSKSAKLSDKNLNQNLSEITLNNTNANQMMSAVTKNMTRLNLDPLESLTDDLSTQLPPPPPERNSSYMIMALQGSKFKAMAANLNTQVPNNNKVQGGYNSSLAAAAVANIKNNNNIISNNGAVSQLSPKMATEYTEINFSGASSSQTANYKQDNKRVSFHDEENNVVRSSPTLSTASEDEDSGITGIGLAEPAYVREDPNKFIDETQAILHTPTTPETSGEQWNMQVQSTPGVIGAQEVYRDPRTKRLAEQQKNQLKNQNDSVPEKLSFKEKMKMFALETGEGQTPKDKLKISRAQRDIDAVH